MSEKQKSKGRKVVYRRIHKSLAHLTADGTKHAFDERLQGALQRQESEPVYFGVSDMSAQKNHSEVFESVTQDTYQEAAKQRATRTRSKHQSPGRYGTRFRRDQIRSPDCLRRAHLSERTRADFLPGGSTPARESSKETQCGGPLDAQFTSSPSIPSQLTPLTTQIFPTFPTPCSMASPHATLSFTFAGLTEMPTEMPTVRPVYPSMEFMEENGISGLGTSGTINRSNLTLPPQPAFQETCRDGRFPYCMHGAGLSILPLYDLPTEGYDFNQQHVESPFTNNSFHGLF